VKKTTFKYPKYPEDLIMSVRYLTRKGLNARKIADRLGISPFTVRNIKRILRERGLLGTGEHESTKHKIKAKNKTRGKKSDEDIIDILLGD